MKSSWRLMLFLFISGSSFLDCVDASAATPKQPLKQKASSSLKSIGLSQRVNAIEKCIFGQTHREQDLNLRLNALEVQIFGEGHSGPALNRVLALEKAIAGGNPNAATFMPPVAPQLDIGTKTPSEAPNMRIAAPLTKRNLNENSHSDTLTSTRNSLQPMSTSGCAGESTEDTGPDNNALTAKNHPALNAKDHPTDHSAEIEQLLKNGISAHNVGNEAEAEKLFREVLKLSPFEPNAYFNLGAIAESKGDLVAALGDYRTALIAHPDDRELQAAIAQVEDQIVQKQSGGHFQNPILSQGDGKTILRGTAADFGLESKASGGYLGTGQASGQSAFQQNASAYSLPAARQQQGYQTAPLKAQAKQSSGKFKAAAGEFAVGMARMGVGVAVRGGNFNPASVINVFHCPICRLLH